MESIRVALGDRAYPIHIGTGILAVADLYRPHLAGGRVAVVTNATVARHYLTALEAALQQAGAQVVVAQVEDGEQAKSWPTVDRLCEVLLASGCGRDSLVVALGGGVVGDLAGFVAAIYQRGVPFVQIPTTLLAQVDSSVGGKTAINHARGKNMIGAFHQPRAVVADVAVLATLPDRELKAGIAEVIKHGAALDATFFEWLERDIDKLVGRDPGALAHAVRRSCELKADIVARDERESGVRALLNFGHTFGHAIEAGAGYGTWLHGEAVAAGMVMAAELSVRETLIGAPDAARLRRLIERAGLPTRAPGFGPDRLHELMAVDKKAEGGKVRFVLLESLGRARVAGGIARAHIDDAILAATQ